MDCKGGGLRLLIPVGHQRQHRQFWRHQGTGLLALAYLLLDKPMQRRFEADPVRATDLLLQGACQGCRAVLPRRGSSIIVPRRREGAIRVFTDGRTSPEVHLPPTPGTML